MFTSPWNPLTIPKCNILSYLFPRGTPPPEPPVWIDADNPSTNLSPAEMLSMIKRFAVGLDRLGLAEQDTVMVLTPNHIFVPLVYLAAAGSKRCFTGANPAYTTHEVADQMKAMEAAIVLVHDTLLETGIAAAGRANIPLHRLFVFSDREPPSSSLRGIRDWRTILASPNESASWQWDPLEGERAVQTIAVVNFSSGTTGLPKGVCVSHHNLVANSAQAIFNQFQSTSNNSEKVNERWLAFLPLYHAYSQLFTINIACKLRIPVYVMPKFALERFLTYIQRYKISALQAVPPVLVMMAKRPETAKYDISSIKQILCGAAPLSSDLQNDVMRRFGLVVCQGFGMSETTCSAIMTPGLSKDLSGSIGYLLPNTEARLVDLEDGDREVNDDGQPGELYLRGPQMMLGYWKNKTASQETKTVDGWLKTGDVAVTRQGKWWIVDRKKELIKVNGLQVAPAELEAVLLEHPDVADAAVVGVTIHEGEECPLAYVVLRPRDSDSTTITACDLQFFVASRVAKHKRLTGGVIFIPEVPKFASGKIIRKVVKEWAKKHARHTERGSAGKILPRL